ncbi:MAG: response regulator [[Clostridium] nexile]
MPDTDGLEVARYVYKNCPDTRVIILTGYAEFEYAQTAISYNVSSFIIKPMNKKELLESVQSIQKQLITSKKRSSIEKEEYAFLKNSFFKI